MSEVNFDGIVGPTHQYGGLSVGNIASTTHAGQVGNPRAAALEGLQKMRFVAQLGVAQGVFPPHPRPDVNALRRLGFIGDDARVLASAWRAEPRLLLSCSSASAMWTANAATVAPSADSTDGKLHLTPANLASMFHRSLEAPVTTRILRAIFSDPDRFAVHDPLPSGGLFADEGAANHVRLLGQSALHLFAWGRSDEGGAPTPQRFPARQTFEASRAVARLNRLPEASVLFWQQHPNGIDAGAFHTDVMAVGNEALLLLHESAFVEPRALLEELRQRLGDGFRFVLATEDQFPSREAVESYAFNSQLITLPNGKMAIVAPRESEQCDAARRFMDRVVAEDNPVGEIFYIDVNASMRNGGGPACLRLRVVLTDAERACIRCRVILDDPLYDALTAWVERHYRDRLTLDDLADPAFIDETRAALDELSTLLALGSIYDFQRG